MTRRLWLHIGSHKTGTTTAQDTFRFNRKLLAGRGLGFAHGTGVSRLHEYLSTIDAAHFLPQGFHVIDPQAFAAHVAEAKGDTVFASSENFSFFFAIGPIAALAAALRAHFDEVRILAYIRRQDRHAISHHQEGARPDRPPEGALWGHSLTALPEPQPLQRLYLDYNARLALWEEIFGVENVTVRMYERAHLKNRDIVADILSVLGVSDEGIQPVADKNNGLGLQKAKVGHLANSIFGDPRITAALTRALPPNDPKMLPKADSARAFLEPYRDSNRALNARRQITEFPDLFPDDFDFYPTAPTDKWNEVSANSAMRAVISVLGSRDGRKNALYFDDLRQAALALREQSPGPALRFAKAAQRIRPNALQITKLVNELQEVITRRDAP